MSATNSQGSSPSDLARGVGDYQQRPGPAPQDEPIDMPEGAPARPPAPDEAVPTGEDAPLGVQVLRLFARLLSGEKEPIAADKKAAEASPAGTVTTTGVIFVHGIGSQKSGDTLLQWSAPLIEVVTAWKAWAAPTGVDEGVKDPVEEAHIDFESELPTITLSIPADPAGDHPPARWIMTEAWWAAKVVPPGLSTMTSWLGPKGGAQHVVNAILGNRADGSQLLARAKDFVVPFVGILSGIVLTGYSLIRGIAGLIPIKAVQDAAIFRIFDEFLTGWFGDVRVLLFDPAQSANIRGGLARAIREFRKQGVDHVVVVAHSGGVMVSYLTLTDPAYKNLKVDKLITFGEGWNLAMILTKDGAGMADRLRRDITDIHEELRWQDFWSTHDPAPAGGVRISEIGKAGAKDKTRITSTKVWNRRSLLDDHGTYFENDEEFTVPLLGEIDRPRGTARESRFYPGPAPNDDPDLPPSDARARRHRERVAILSLWRHLALAIPVVTIAATLADSTRLFQLGARALGFVNEIPVVNKLILEGIGPALVNFFRGLQVPNIVFGQFSLPDAVSHVGLWTLQAIVLISMIQLIFAPVEAYQAWPVESWRRRVFLLVEWVVIGLLVASLIPLIVMPILEDREHNTLLGSGSAWAGGIGLTAATLALGALGAWLGRRPQGSAERLASVRRATTRGFAWLTTGLFVLAMFCAIRVIFERTFLEVGEIGYVVIWFAFFVLYRLGHGRWSEWDKVERRAAYATADGERPSRTPVWFSMAGFTLAGAALVAAILAWWDQGVTNTLTLVALLLIIGAAILGAFAWGKSRNELLEPTAVESARGRV